MEEGGVGRRGGRNQVRRWTSKCGVDQRLGQTRRGENGYTVRWKRVRNEVDEVEWWW